MTDEIKFPFKFIGLTLRMHVVYIYILRNGLLRERERERERRRRKYIY